MKKSLLNAVHGTPLTKAAQKKIKGGSFDFEPEPCEVYYVWCRNMYSPMLVLTGKNDQGTDICKYYCGNAGNIIACHPYC